MSVTYKLNGTALTGRIQFLPREGQPPGLNTAAEKGVLGTCGVMIEDIGASLTFNGWGLFTVEDSAASPVRVFKGLVVDRGIGRKSTFFAGASRVYDCDLYDLNILLQWLTPLDNDAKRPDETDVERVAWMLTDRCCTDPIVNSTAIPIEDKGLVSTDNPGAYLASDCRRRYPNDILREIVESSVKNFFLYDDLASDDVGLFHDRDDATVWASGISISNILADVNNTTVFAPDEELNAQRAANDVYASVSYGYKAADPIFVESASIAAEYDMNRQAVYDTPRVGRLATALEQAAAWLAVRATEPDTITTRIRVPSSKLNEVLAGQEIEVTLTHVPRYESGAIGRIRRKTYWPAALGKWDVELEIYFPPTPAEDATPGGGCVPTATHATLYENDNLGSPAGPAEYEITFNRDGDNESGGYASDPLVGLVEYAPNYAGAPPLRRGLTVHGTGTLTVTGYLSVAGADDGDQRLRFAILVNGVEVLFQEQFTTGGLRFISFGTNPTGWGTIDVVDGDVISVFFTAICDTPTFLTFPAGTDHTYLTIDGDLCADPPAESPLPGVGDPVGPETPTGDIDGANNAFETAGPWVPGTLRVLHDGIDQTAHIATSDNIAGTFALDYIPDIGSTIRAVYESA